MIKNDKEEIFEHVVPLIGTMFSIENNMADVDYIVNVHDETQLKTAMYVAERAFDNWLTDENESDGYIGEVRNALEKLRIHADYYDKCNFDNE